MFGKRSDGRRLRKLDPYFKLMPHIMTLRSGSQVLYVKNVDTVPLSAYLEEKRAQGMSVTNMHVVIAAAIRTIGARPALNRYVMNGRLFARDGVWMSITIKRSMSDDGEETTVKRRFEGNEDFETIYRILYHDIRENKKENTRNDTDKLAERFMSLPNFIVKGVVGFLKWCDRHDMLPRSIIEASPFHTSFYITNVKSIGLNYIFHHLYDFGTTSIFISMGKKHQHLSMDQEQVKASNVMDLGFTVDERICDGYYLAKSLSLMDRFLENPKLLDTAADAPVRDVD